MKRLLLITLSIFWMVSCTKEERNSDTSKDYLLVVQNGLKDSLSATDFEALDFSRAVMSKVDSFKFYFLRIPFKGTSIASDFVMMRTTREGKIQQGRILHLTKMERQEGVNSSTYNGSIIIQTLKRQLVVQSAIKEGFIQAFHPNRPLQRTSLLDPELLPEVVVVASYPASGGVSYSDWMALEGMMGGGNYGGGMGSTGGGGSGGSASGSGSYSGSNSGYYTPVQPEEHGSTGSGTVASAPVIELEPEYMYNIATVDIKKIFNCFDYIPSVGASYTIQLCADLPSNDDPYASSNGSAISAGHTFLILTKTNGSSSVTQSFGFYPQHEPPLLNPFAPVPSAVKDNGGQEINASIAMTINESQFNVIKQYAIAGATKSYELGDYNCTNYAVEIFNAVRSNPITMVPFKVVIGGSVNGYNPTNDPVTTTIYQSPQMLFVKLRQLKSSNSTEAAQIKIDGSHKYRAPISQGECN